MGDSFYPLHGMALTPTALQTPDSNALYFSSDWCSSPSVETKDGDVGKETSATAMDLPKPCDAMESAPGDQGLTEKQYLECGLEQSGSTPAPDGKAKGGAKLKRKANRASSADTAKLSQDSSMPTPLPQQGETEQCLCYGVQTHQLIGTARCHTLIFYGHANVLHVVVHGSVVSMTASTV